MLKKTTVLFVTFFVAQSVISQSLSTDNLDEIALKYAKSSFGDLSLLNFVNT